MGFIKTPEHLTVGTLRKYLDDMESEWTKTDVSFLGKFENLQINCWVKNEGAGPAQIVYDGGLDFVILDKDDD